MNDKKAITKFQAVVLVAIVVIAAVVGAYFYFGSQPPREKFKIGVFISLTGAYAIAALDIRNGLELAVEDLNAKGGILGKQVELIVYDDQLKLENALALVDTLLYDDKVDIIVGGDHAGIAYAVHTKLKPLNKVYGCTCAMALSGFNKTEIADSGTFDIMTHSYNAGSVGAVFISRYLTDVKKVIIILPGYVFGYNARDGFIEGLRRLAPNVQVIDTIETPIGCTDFSPYLTKVLSENPDLFVTAHVAADLTNLLKQAYEMGVQKKMKMLALWSYLINVQPLPPEHTEGVYFQVQFYWNIPSTRPEYNTVKNFTDRFIKKYNRPPDHFSATTYILVMELARGINLAQSTEADKVRQALLANPEFDSIKGRGKWRADHTAVMENFMYICVGKSAAARTNEWDVFNVVYVAGGEDAYIPLEKLGYP